MNRCVTTNAAPGDDDPSRCGSRRRGTASMVRSFRWVSMSDGEPPTRLAETGQRQSGTVRRDGLTW
jgi:hypothetical protein